MPTKFIKRIFIVDNGAVPFTVDLSSLSGHGIASINKHTKKNNKNFDVKDPKIHDKIYKHWRDFKYDHVWIGLDPQEHKPSFWKKLFGNPWWYGGSSVLLKYGSKFIVINWGAIFEFKMEKGDEVIDFISEIGNNTSAVPYPYIIGSQNTYLTIDFVFIPNSLKDSDDPYYIFYNTDLKTGKEIKSLSKQRKIADKFKKKHKMKDVVILHKQLIIH